MVTTFIFDLGGVLIRNPAQGLVDYCAQHLGVASSDFKAAFSRFEAPYQRGELSEAAFWEGMCQTLHCSLPRLPSLWESAFASVYKPIPEMFRLVERLHGQHYTTALLSNTEAPVVRFFTQQQIPPFTAAIYSCNVGMRKPEARIYLHILELLRVHPEDAVFIDDRQDYLDGAKAVGLNTILFQNPQQTERSLAAYLD